VRSEESGVRGRGSGVESARALMHGLHRMHKRIGGIQAGWASQVAAGAGVVARGRRESGGEEKMREYAGEESGVRGQGIREHSPVELFEWSKALNLLNRWGKVEALNLVGSHWWEGVCGEV
jgi:hypothetical protein